jgi:hypothetical protein
MVYSGVIETGNTEERQMKISVDQFSHLESLFNMAVDKLGLPADAQIAPTVRARWDILNTLPYDMALRPLYDAGLNDDHIDTALRKIVERRNRLTKAA